MIYWPLWSADLWGLIGKIYLTVFHILIRDQSLGTRGGCLGMVTSYDLKAPTFPAGEAALSLRGYEVEADFRYRKQLPKHCSLNPIYWTHFSIWYILSSCELRGGCHWRKPDGLKVLWWSFLGILCASRCFVNVFLHVIFCSLNKLLQH